MGRYLKIIKQRAIKFSTIFRTLLYQSNFLNRFGLLSLSSMNVGHLLFIILIPFFYHQGLNLSKPLDVYDMLGCQVGSIKENEVKVPEAWNNSLDKCGSPYLLQNAKPIGLDKFESISRSVIKKYLKFNDILKWSQMWRHILRT